MIFEHKLETPAEAMISITKQVKEAIAQSKVTDGICVVYCPHTTAGITINENSDPHVVQDILLGLQMLSRACRPSGTTRAIRPHI